MATSREYKDFISDQLSGMDGVFFRPMMGEFILYRHDKIIGGIYDDRFLVKITASSLELLPGAARELPYEGAKEMLLVERVEDRAFLEKLLEAVAADLPAPKKSKRGS